VLLHPSARLVGDGLSVDELHCLFSEVSFDLVFSEVSFDLVSEVSASSSVWCGGGQVGRDYP